MVALDTTPAGHARASSEIVKTLVEALVLVIIVVFIFLQGWRADADSHCSPCRFR